MTPSPSHSSKGSSSSKSSNTTPTKTPSPASKVLKQAAEYSRDADTPKKCSCPATTVTKAQQSVPTAKSHKIEGKNKRSLHHKQQASLERQQHQQQFNDPQQAANALKTRQDGASRRQKSTSGSANANKVAPEQNVASLSPSSSATCVTLDDFYKRAQELKADIQKSLKKASTNKTIDRPIEVVKLKEDILKLAGLSELEIELNSSKPKAGDVPVDYSIKSKDGQVADCEINEDERTSKEDQVDLDKSTSQEQQENLKNTAANTRENESSDVRMDSESADKACTSDCTKGYKSDATLTEALDNLTLDRSETNPGNESRGDHKAKDKKQGDSCKQRVDDKRTSAGFEGGQTTLDEKTKFCALMAAFKTQFEPAPHLLEPICRQLAIMSDQKWQLQMKNNQYQAENQRLLLVKQKLENLCRELQKSNNAIRCESLELIKAEQGKAKAQTTKIQSTLSGVIKLFDENQQRNMALRQENQDLQTKLKSLLEHCDNCERSVETALRQRDIENRLLKTELAKANLSRNEEKEKFLGEKQELLQILSMMQEQQHRIEGQEAKLRSDLSSYASKYDECQAVINKGMNRFQTESKKMLKTIEKSKQDYKVLLTKYETSNKKMSQLLEEKQYWDRTLNLANKKIETLEKLCRALRGEQKQVEQETQHKKPVNLPPPPPEQLAGTSDPKKDTGTVHVDSGTIKALDLTLAAAVTANQEDDDQAGDNNLIQKPNPNIDNSRELQTESMKQEVAKEQSQKQVADQQLAENTATGGDDKSLDKDENDKDLPMPEFVI